MWYLTVYRVTRILEVFFKIKLLVWYDLVYIIGLVHPV